MKNSKGHEVLSQPDRIKRARADKTVANLRKHYERGRLANQELAVYRPRELAQIYGVNSSTLRKDRAFARCYSDEELNELLRLRRPNGLPLHWGHLLCLISVNGEKARTRLQKRAAKEGWSAPELCAAIRQRTSNREGGGGRPVKVPETTERKLELLIEETHRWLRRYEAVCGDNGQSLINELTANAKKAYDDPTRDLADKLDKMSQASRRLSAKLKRR